MAYLIAVGVCTASTFALWLMWRWIDEFISDAFLREDDE